MDQESFALLSVHETKGTCWVVKVSKTEQGSIVEFSVGAVKLCFLCCSSLAYQYSEGVTRWQPFERTSTQTSIRSTVLKDQLSSQWKVCKDCLWAKREGIFILFLPKIAGLLFSYLEFILNIFAPYWKQFGPFILWYCMSDKSILWCHPFHPTPPIPTLPSNLLSPSDPQDG